MHHNLSPTLSIPPRFNRFTREYPVPRIEHTLASLIGLSQQAIVTSRSEDAAVRPWLRFAACLELLDAGLFGGFTDLVNLDDVALGIVEEDLMPSFDGPCAEIGKGHIALCQTALDAFDVIRPERDMTALKRVDGLLGAKRDVQIEGGQVHFALAIRQESYASAIALILDLLLIAGVGVALRKLEHVLVEIFQIGGIFGAQVDVMKLCRHGWDP